MLELCTDSFIFFRVYLVGFIISVVIFHTISLLTNFGSGVVFPLNRFVKLTFLRLTERESGFERQLYCRCSFSAVYVSQVWASDLSAFEVG